MGVDIEHCDVSHTVFDGCTDDVDVVNFINDAKKEMFYLTSMHLF